MTRRVSRSSLRGLDFHLSRRERFIQLTIQPLNQSHDRRQFDYRPASAGIFTGPPLFLAGESDAVSLANLTSASGNSTPPMSFITCIIGGRVLAIPLRK